MCIPLLVYATGKSLVKRSSRPYTVCTGLCRRRSCVASQTGFMCVAARSKLYRQNGYHVLRWKIYTIAATAHLQLQSCKCIAANAQLQCRLIPYERAPCTVLVRNQSSWQVMGSTCTSGSMWLSTDARASSTAAGASTNSCSLASLLLATACCSCS